MVKLPMIFRFSVIYTAMDKEDLLLRCVCSTMTLYIAHKCFLGYCDQLFCNCIFSFIKKNKVTLSYMDV